jgi:hypothetical protein
VKGGLIDICVPVSISVLENNLAHLSNS